VISREYVARCRDAVRLLRRVRWGSKPHRRSRSSPDCWRKQTRMA
jgi:hypothetical protein